MMQKPNKKVAAGGLAGGLSALMVWGLEAAGLEVPPQVAAAIATLVAFAVSYLVPEKAQQPAAKRP